MTIYETIKAAISVKQAAEHYGLKVSHNGMACCPFHNDRHPSLKLNEDYFFCFGCGAKGDVIDLVARLFNLSSYEAAQKLALDFGLDPKPPTAAAMVKPKRPYIRQLREDEMLCFRVLTDYLHLDELAVMPSSCCIVQVQGVRPFYSKKYDLTKHPQYKYTADANPKYAFDVKAYLQHRLKVKPEEEFEVYDLGEMEQPQAAA